MTITVEKYIGGVRYIEGVALAAEISSLPTDVVMGSKLFVLDENKTYYYKDENDGWIDPTAE